MTEPLVVFDGPHDADWTVALAHGAGAPMDSPFMQAITVGLVSRGLLVARFEFPYMAARRRDGRRRPPDRPPVLLDTWRQVIDSLRPRRLVIGGKSMGGRIASLIADDRSAGGLVCFGYPFHAPGKPDRLRIDHLAGLSTPALIVQGTRDALGCEAEVPAYPLSPSVRIAWIPDGDHDLRPRKSSGRTMDQNWEEAAIIAAAFVTALKP